MPTVDVILEQHDLTLDDLMDRSGLPFKRVEAIVFGRWTPSPAERQRVADALGVAVADVVWGHVMDPRNVRYHRFGLKKDFHKDGEEGE
jgi:transcriptional regulator with XRE-family HTH domain